jgi:D-glucosaminate-6-phosphate ammonia-lyase
MAEVRENIVSNIPAIFEEMGAKPVINGCGVYTFLGGARLSPTIMSAIQDLNQYFISMSALLETSGKIIAKITGAEAARVTPGAAASNMLMAAAAMTGNDESKTEVIPHVQDLRHEFIMQRNHDNTWKRQLTMTGAKIVWAGDETGTTLGQLEQVVTPKTAAFFIPAHLNGLNNTVPLPEIVALARRHTLPVFVDAAYHCWPLENLTRYVREGADLVCYSAKYFGGPNAGGFITGKQTWIDAVTKNDFTRYGSSQFYTYGRPLKMDRFNVVATVLALQEWLALDHDERWANYNRMVDTMYDKLNNVTGIRLEKSYFTMEETLEPEPVNSLVVYFENSKTNAEEVGAKLAALTPSVWVNVWPDNKLIICLDQAVRGEEVMIAERLKEALG